MTRQMLALPTVEWKLVKQCANFDRLSMSQVMVQAIDLWLRRRFQNETFLEQVMRVQLETVQHPLGPWTTQEQRNKAVGNIRKARQLGNAAVQAHEEEL